MTLSQGFLNCMWKWVFSSIAAWPRRLAARNDKQTLEDHETMWSETSEDETLPKVYELNVH